MFPAVPPWPHVFLASEHSVLYHESAVKWEGRAGCGANLAAADLQATPTIPHRQVDACEEILVRDVSCREGSGGRRGRSGPRVPSTY